MIRTMLYGGVAIALSVLAPPAIGYAQGSPSSPSPYLLVLAADADGQGEDFFAVIDVAANSPTVGKVVSTRPFGHKKSMPHHMEYVLPERGHLVFANAHHAEATMLLDVSQAPALKVAKSLPLPNGLRFPHDYARLPTGNVLVGFLRSPGKSPAPDETVDPGGHGGIAEYTADGRLLRSASAAVDGLAKPVRIYAMVPLIEQDRIVTTSARMMEKHSANVIQIWRYSDFKLLKTIAVPAGKKVDGSALDWANEMPFGPRLMADGSILMNSYMCGFYRITGIATEDPKVAHVYDIQGSDPASLNTRVGCSVPVVIGSHWIMPVAWSEMVVTLDVSDPSSPREIARLAMPDKFAAHWAARDPGSNRIVIGAETEKERGLFVLLHDPVSGALSLDRSIGTAAAPGYIDMAGLNWPHGKSGGAIAHAALFMPAGKNDDRNAK